MADVGGNGDGGATSAADCSAHSRSEIKEEGDSSEDLDSISSLPDVILQEILSLIPTRIAVITSVLSKRWRHVWSDTPFLSFTDDILWNVDSLNKTLARYTAPKIKSFELIDFRIENRPYIDRWIEFTMSRNVENISLSFLHYSCNVSDEFTISNCFYNNPSVKQLSVEFFFSVMKPKCSVSWTSLKILSLYCCVIDEESFAKILSGSPFLETLIFSVCNDLIRVLDLSKSMRLKTLVVETDPYGILFPMHIVAPHIHCLSSISSQSTPSTFVDVSSLTQAKLDFCFKYSRFKVDFPQGLALQQLDKLQNVDKLILGENFLKMLSLAELRGVPFPIFKAKALTLETTISQYVTCGIVRLLQNSPHLKKLTLVHTMGSDTIPEEDLNNYLDSHGLSPDQCWVFGITSPLESKHVVSLMEIMLENTKTLEKIVILGLKGYLEGRDFEELLHIVPMLSHDNNVSIMLS